MLRVLLRKGSSYRRPWIYNTWEPFYRGIEEKTTQNLVGGDGLGPFDPRPLRDGLKVLLPPPGGTRIPEIRRAP